MKAVTLLKIVHKIFDQRSFTTYNVIKCLLRYHIHPPTRNAIYVAIHRCWKMGLLSRTKFSGRGYIYQITNWGMRYLEKGYLYREDEIRIKLLRYIVDHGDLDDKRWAENVLVPRLLQRFFPGRKAQQIFPSVDIIKVCYQASEILKQRIRDATVLAQQNLDSDIMSLCLRDIWTVILIAELLEQLGSPSNLKICQIFIETQRRTLREALLEILSYYPQAIEADFPKSPSNVLGEKKMKAHGLIQKRPPSEKVLEIYDQLRRVEVELEKILHMYWNQRLLLT